MIVLQAPANSPQTTIILPNPQFDDTENYEDTVALKRAMDNTVYTYITRSGLRKLKYRFQLFRPKSLELEAFLDSYLLAPILMQSYKNELWSIRFVNDPFEYAFVGRDNYTEITLEMEGILIQTIHTRHVSDSLIPTLWDSLKRNIIESNSDSLSLSDNVTETL